jgi:hypothetical protein
MLRVGSADVVRRQDDHSEACRAAMVFKLLDDRATGVRLLVKDYGVQARPFDQAGDFYLCWSIVAVDDEDVEGRVGGRCGSIFERCGLFKLSKPLLQGAGRLTEQRNRALFFPATSPRITSGIGIGPAKLIGAVSKVRAARYR